MPARAIVIEAFRAWLAEEQPALFESLGRNPAKAEWAKFARNVDISDPRAPNIAPWVWYDPASPVPVGLWYGAVDGLPVEWGRDGSAPAYLPPAPGWTERLETMASVAAANAAAPDLWLLGAGLVLRRLAWEPPSFLAASVRRAATLLSGTPPARRHWEPDSANYHTALQLWEPLIRGVMGPLAAAHDWITDDFNRIHGEVEGYIVDTSLSGPGSPGPVPVKLMLYLRTLVSSPGFNTLLNEAWDRVRPLWSTIMEGVPQVEGPEYPDAWGVQAAMRRYAPQEFPPLPVEEGQGAQPSHGEGPPPHKVYVGDPGKGQTVERDTVAQFGLYAVGATDPDKYTITFVPNGAAIAKELDRVTAITEALLLHERLGDLGSGVAFGSGADGLGLDTLRAMGAAFTQAREQAKDVKERQRAGRLAAQQAPKKPDSDEPAKPRRPRVQIVVPPLEEPTPRIVQAFMDPKVIDPWPMPGTTSRERYYALWRPETLAAMEGVPEGAIDARVLASKPEAAALVPYVESYAEYLTAKAIADHEAYNAKNPAEAVAITDDLVATCRRRMHASGWSMLRALVDKDLTLVWEFASAGSASAKWIKAVTGHEVKTYQENPERQATDKAARAQEQARKVALADLKQHEERVRTLERQPVIIPGEEGETTMRDYLDRHIIPFAVLAVYTRYPKAPYSICLGPGHLPIPVDLTARSYIEHEVAARGGTLPVVEGNVAYVNEPSLRGLRAGTFSPQASLAVWRFKSKGAEQSRARDQVVVVLEQLSRQEVKRLEDQTPLNVSGVTKVLLLQATAAELATQGVLVPGGPTPAARQQALVEPPDYAALHSGATPTDGSGLRSKLALLQAQLREAEAHIARQPANVVAWEAARTWLRTAEEATAAALTTLNRPEEEEQLAAYLRRELRKPRTLAAIQRLPNPRSLADDVSARFHGESTHWSAWLSRELDAVAREANYGLGAYKIPQHPSYPAVLAKTVESFIAEVAAAWRAGGKTVVQDDPEAATVWRFEVPVDNLPSLRAKLAKLVRKAEKLGLPPIEVRELEPILKHLKDSITDQPYSRQYVPFEVTEPEALVRMEGWRFVATIDHGVDDTGKPLNLILASPRFGQNLPVRFRTDPATCDHCQTHRKRNQTFVVQNNEEGFKRVGRQCLADFVGEASAARVMGLSTLLSDVRSAFEESFEGGGGSGSPDSWYFPAPQVMAHAAWVIRNIGWTSRREARDRDMEASADVVWNRLTWPLRKQPPGAKPPPRPEEQDVAQGAAVIEWARGIDPDTPSDYLSNVRVVFTRGSIGAREVGIATSAIPAWARDNKREVGQEGLIHPSAGPGSFIRKVGDRFGGKKKGSPPPLLVQIIAMAHQPIIGDYGASRWVAARNIEGEDARWYMPEDRIPKELTPGAWFEVTGTVSKHGRFKDRNVTSLNRVELAPAKPPAVLPGGRPVPGQPGPAGPEPQPAGPKPIYFASGATREAEIRALAAAGQPVGVTVSELTPASQQALVDIASLVPVFVDSGAFSEVAFTPQGPEYPPTKEIRWSDVLTPYRWLADQWPSRAPGLYLVAPDRVGDPEHTANLWRNMAMQMRAFNGPAVHVIVPLQRGGDWTQARMWTLARKAFRGLSLVAGIPSKKDATTLEELRTTLQLLRADPPAAVHFLGLAPGAPGGQERLAMVREILPGAQVFFDSVYLRGKVGNRTNPGPYMEAKDAAREEAEEVRYHPEGSVDDAELDTDDLDWLSQAARLRIADAVVAGRNLTGPKAAAFRREFAADPTESAQQVPYFWDAALYFDSYFQDALAIEVAAEAHKVETPGVTAQAVREVLDTDPKAHLWQNFRPSEHALWPEVVGGFYTPVAKAILASFDPHVDWRGHPAKESHVKRALATTLGLGSNPSEDDVRVVERVFAAMVADPLFFPDRPLPDADVEEQMREVLRRAAQRGLHRFLAREPLTLQQLVARSAGDLHGLIGALTSSVIGNQEAEERRYPDVWPPLPGVGRMAYSALWGWPKIVDAVVASAVYAARQPPPTNPEPANPHHRNLIAGAGDRISFVTVGDSKPKSEALYHARSDVPPQLASLTVPQANYWSRVYDAVLDREGDSGKAARIAWHQVRRRLATHGRVPAVERLPKVEKRPALPHPTTGTVSNGLPAAEVQRLEAIAADWQANVDRLTYGGEPTLFDEAGAVAWGRQHGLDLLGGGASRVVFGLEDGERVIKLNLLDPTATLNEIAAWQAAPPTVRRFLVPILAWDLSGRWLVMEWVDDQSGSLTREARAVLQAFGVEDLEGGSANVSADGRVYDYGEWWPPGKSEALPVDSLLDAIPEPIRRASAAVSPVGVLGHIAHGTDPIDSIPGGPELKARRDAAIQRAAEWLRGATGYEAQPVQELADAAHPPSGTPYAGR